MPEPATIDLASLPSTSKYSPKFIPIENITSLRDKGLSQSQIAKILGCSREAIQQRLARVDYQQGETKEYVRNRADILASFQWRLLSSLTDADIKKMVPDRRIWCYGVLFDKERMERGQSTENISIASVAMHLQCELADHQARSKSLQEQLESRGICVSNLAPNGLQKAHMDDVDDGNTIDLDRNTEPDISTR